MSFHRQCVMEKPINGMGGVMTQVGWIPEEFAKVGKRVRLLDDDGWKVVSVGGRKPSKEVNERSQDCKKHRRGTDASRHGGNEDWDLP